MSALFFFLVSFQRSISVPVLNCTQTRDTTPQTSTQSMASMHLRNWLCGCRAVPVAETGSCLSLTGDPIRPSFTAPSGQSTNAKYYVGCDGGSRLWDLAPGQAHTLHSDGVPASRRFYRRGNDIQDGAGLIWTGSRQHPDGEGHDHCPGLVYPAVTVGSINQDEFLADRSIHLPRIDWTEVDLGNGIYC